MCGLEALMLALKLGSEIAQPLYDHNSLLTTVPAVCGCSCGARSQADLLMCQVMEMRAESERIEKHNVKVQEFQRIARMCGVPK